MTYLLVIKCNRTGVTTVKNPTNEYAATAIDMLPKELISLYKSGCAMTPIRLDDNENN